MSDTPRTAALQRQYSQFRDGDLNRLWDLTATCDHDWRMQDDSFDHEFGCEVIRYWLCEKCGAVKLLDSADFGDPEP